ncbi:MAG: helix-turn-helix domain-containing protein [Pseudonocardiaceae bacterium]
MNALKEEGASALAREPAHVVAQRRELGRRLATARSAVGLTQQNLARALYYERTSVAHIEGGRQPAPRSFWGRADVQLGAGGTLLAGYDDLERAKAAHAAKAAPAAPIETIADASTIALRWLVASADAGPSRERGWRRIGAADVARVRTVRKHLKAMDDALGGNAAFPMTTSYLRQEVAPLLGGQYDAEVGRDLLAVVAEVTLDLGWMAYDAGQQTHARHHMLHALRLSHAAQDRLFGGRVLSALSHQALHLGRIGEATDLARAATRGTKGIATPRVVAMFAAMEACAAAAAHDSAGCTAALSKAERALDAASSDKGPDWLDFDEGGLWGHAARAHRDLGHPNRAREFAQQALIHCRDAHRRTRAQRRAILATTLLDSGELDGACSIGEELLVDAWQLHSALVIDDVRRLLDGVTARGTGSGEGFLLRARELLAARSTPQQQ